MKLASFVVVIVLSTSLVFSACNYPQTSNNSDQPATVAVENQETAPSIELSMTEDPMGGFNLYAETQNFRFRPEKLGQPHQEGEGYLQILLNGKPVGRMYQPYFHLNLESGDEVAVVATSNDGRTYQLDGQVIQATANTPASEATDDAMAMEREGMTMEEMKAAETAEHAAHGHDHDKPFIVSQASQAPSVTLAVTPDPVSGWNAHLVTENFTFTPELASQDETKIGQGHAHIYIDGEKISRVYGDWFYISSLEPGSHEIKVNLNANSHNPYSYDGVEVMDTITVEVE